MYEREHSAFGKLTVLAPQVPHPALPQPAYVISYTCVVQPKAWQSQISRGAKRCVRDSDVLQGLPANQVAQIGDTRGRISPRIKWTPRPDGSVAKPTIASQYRFVHSQTPGHSIHGKPPLAQPLPYRHVDLRQRPMQRPTRHLDRTRSPSWEGRKERPFEDLHEDPSIRQQAR